MLALSGERNQGLQKQAQRPCHFLGSAAAGAGGPCQAGSLQDTAHHEPSEDIQTGRRQGAPPQPDSRDLWLQRPLHGS